MRAYLYCTPVVVSSFALRLHRRSEQRNEKSEINLHASGKILDMYHTVSNDKGTEYCIPRFSFTSDAHERLPGTSPHHRYHGLFVFAPRKSRGLV
jgi:hypothetical protein